MIMKANLRDQNRVLVASIVHLLMNSRSSQVCYGQASTDKVVSQPKRHEAYPNEMP